MKVIIAGGRDYVLQIKHVYRLMNIINSLEKLYGDLEFVSGHANGADAIGELISICKGKKPKVFEADWIKYQRSAGPIRNGKMAEYSDICILLPGGTGTDNMRKQAKEYELKIIEV